MKIKIEGFEGYFIDSDGIVYSTKSGKEKELKIFTDKRGYCYVSLCELNKRYNCSIHRLVASAFIPNERDYPNVCHKDDNPRNNRVENLFWGTQQDNIKDKVKKDRQQKGSKCHNSVLTEEQVLEIKNTPNFHGSGRLLSKKFSVHESVICSIRHNRTWVHV